MGRVSEGPKEFRFRFIKNHRECFGVRYLCRKLFVSFSGFYKWLNRPISLRAIENGELVHSIKRIFERHDGNYGSPRIHRTLVDLGLVVNHKRVARIMREERLIAKAELYLKIHVLRLITFDIIYHLLLERISNGQVMLAILKLMVSGFIYPLFWIFIHVKLLDGRSGKIELQI